MCHRDPYIASAIVTALKDKVNAALQHCQLDIIRYMIGTGRHHALLFVTLFMRTSHDVSQHSAHPVFGQSGGLGDLQPVRQSDHATL